MVDKKTAGIVLLLVGIIILAVSLLADPIGIGNDKGIGGQQMLGIIGGAVVVVVGLVLTLRERSSGAQVSSTQR